ncbi:MAG: Transporter, EamA family [Candidatus Uhrbacteria bacterium GW2011_GWE2_45_35]|uniref:Transporter, EamA family n=2 Tax=Candidatus Uhriibacteriota TaxID=1752732 RepID=A0A0G1JFI5_9BACT|nr:MAG: Transporter, EamA family [Candidatus Uhrbacteria bacterium GW2011_GWF2_44_350]KKU06852.1 MAG: Transporter, EamA family [Candidatus Uhrbacteria bacterium GW2011_GWE2_45_35]HBR80773.1 EamA family transporter [Candidatus Uhrbacteria bacterium]HCU31773.1 EamA family transporter [Candidatus Uhrbacteria bacterium]
MWLLFAFLAAVTAALMTVFGKLGLKGIDPILATTVRSILMAGFLVAVSLFSKKFQGFSLSSFGSRDWWLIGLAGLAGALSWLFYFAALKTGDATKVAAIDRLSIVFIVLMAGLFLGETTTWKTVLGAVFISGGAFLIVW